MRGQGAGDSGERRAERGVLVVCGGWDVAPDAVVLKTVAAARVWAGRFEPPLPVSVIVLGGASGGGEMLGGVGGDCVFVCPEVDMTTPIQSLAETVAQLAAGQGDAWIFLIADGPLKSISPFVAGLLGAPVVSYCEALERDETGNCTAWRACHQGRLQQRITLSYARVRVIAWDVDALPRPDASGSLNTAVVNTLELMTPGYVNAICPEKLIKGDPRTLPLVVAEQVLALGRGVSSEEMPLIEKVADRLGASLGGTRPVVDQGMLPYARQIGQTGVRITPRLLLACGISGANEFTVGIDGAQTVVAVNTDPQARIYQMADLGLVGDWRTVLENMLVLLDEGAAENRQEPRLEE